MRNRLWAPVVVSFVVTMGLFGCNSPRTVSTATLLHEMTDLTNLAEFPDPAYTCRQFSSYDRASTTPDDAKTWFANDDSGQYLRIEERGGHKEYVIMDAAGPGAIVRFWSANPRGTLRFYLDNAPEPTLEVAMADWLGGKAGIPVPVSCERSAGWNNYFPIPYARHCKVTGDQIVSEDGKHRVYYHINYRTYAPGTEVVPFKSATITELTAKINEIASALDSPRSVGGGPNPRPGQRDELSVTGRETITSPSGGVYSKGEFDVNPGQRYDVWHTQRTSAGAIVALRAKVEAKDTQEALRHLILEIDFDDEQTVLCPLGDFFGAGPGINPYESLPLGITKGGEMWSHWVMPYRHTARIDLRNDGDAAAKVGLAILTMPYEWTTRSMHFGAGWHSAHDVPTRPMQDWNYIDLAGQGVFVGAAFAIANPVRQWWGEGDEKIYVDGEKFPSHFGTGTEDYYGYAWCCNVPFTHAYHNQPRCDGPGNYGNTAVNRWHIMDRIPFRHDFRFDMELWHWWDGRVPAMSVVTYWYARPGATSNRQSPTPVNLQLATIPPYVPPRVAGALEGEELQIIAKTGNPQRQELEQCSNEAQLWWRDAKPGETLVLGFPVETAGRYRVLVRCIKARDYGIVQLSVNDTKAGAPIDLYNDGIKLTDELPLGEFDLKAGENRLSAEITGANEHAAKAYMFGLDYIRLVPAK